MKKIGKQRKDYLSWDEYFMGIALLSAKRSKDPNTQVGACIVKDKKILSVGYNGAPNGFDDDVFPWDRIGDKLETKYMYVCHAELNAILNYKGNSDNFQGATIYVYFFPCNECAKAIIQAGIKKVIYYNNYDHDNHAPEMEASIRMFNQCGVKFEHMKPANKEVNLKL